MSHRFETTFAFAVLLGVLSRAPLALGLSLPQAQSQPGTQAQSQAASKSQSQSAPSDQSHTQSPDQSTPPTASKAYGTSSNRASSTEPQMQSQEAPPADSLGEAARKARAQKTNAPAAKVYTEEKIAGLPSHGVSVVGDANQSAGDDSSAAGNAYAAPSANGKPPAGKTEEQFWREKARAIHDQMAQIDDRIGKIQEEIQKYGAVSFDPATGLRQNVIYVQDRNAQIKQLEEQKGKLQSQLDSLEEQGRKAGADSGWFR